jgi:hypothetical protein
MLNAQATKNKIVNYDSINLQTGVRKTKPVNVNGVYNIGSTISYSQPIKFLKGSVEISSNTGYYSTKQLINTSNGQIAQNDIKTFSFSPELRLTINPTQKLGFEVSNSVSYTNTKYSLAAVPAINYLSYEYGASIDWEMPKGFYFASDFTYSINSQRAIGFNTKVPIWNASLSKQMLKFSRGELKITAKDLLNKNVGISRNTNNNYIEDSRVLILRQFFLVSFTYSLSKTGLNNAGGGGMRVIAR